MLHETIDVIIDRVFNANESLFLEGIEAIRNKLLIYTK